jgi:hypothetical protein
LSGLWSPYAERHTQGYDDDDDYKSSLLCTSEVLLPCFLSDVLLHVQIFIFITSYYVSTWRDFKRQRVSASLNYVSISAIYGSQIKTRLSELCGTLKYATYFAFNIVFHVTRSISIVFSPITIFVYVRNRNMTHLYNNRSGTNNYRLATALAKYIILLLYNTEKIIQSFQKKDD